MNYVSVSDTDFAELDGLTDWRINVNTIRAVFATKNFATAASLSSAIAAAADAADHHPDIEIRYPGIVRVSLTTHATGGLTTLDVDLARVISRLAEGVGAQSRPTNAEVFEIGIDTNDADRIRPFWSAVLGYRVAADGSLFDPLRVGPAIWFQPMGSLRTERNRIHFDIIVAHDEADARVAAALAAGGNLRTAEFARAFWVLADADGNEVCVCTWLDRDKDKTA